MRGPLARATLPLLVCLGLTAGAHAAADETEPALTLGDGGAAEHEPDLVVPQWERLLPRLAAEARTYDACAARRGGPCAAPEARAWLSFLARIGSASRAEQVRAVHAFVNRWPYRADDGTWGRRDYWATPLEFLSRSGDCEDYAIAKYVSLRRLGVPADDLRLLVVQDTARDIAHAVLAARLDDGWHVLDNLSERVRPLALVDHYRPYYALNEDSRWVFPQAAWGASAAGAGG